MLQIYKKKNYAHTLYITFTQNFFTCYNDDEDNKTVRSYTFPSSRNVAD